MTVLTRQHDALYTQLLQISRQASAVQAYEMAYHTLFAAMHRAVQLDEVALLEEVIQEADAQHQQLNSAHPEHPLSSRSAAQCGHECSYSLLKREIITNIQLLETKELLPDGNTEGRAS
jgi:hypothetical protein